MILSRLRKKLALKRRAVQAQPRPRPWPVDPDLSRRAAETRERIARTRREIERHVLPARRHHRGMGGGPRSASRAGRR